MGVHIIKDEFVECESIYRIWRKDMRHEIKPSMRILASALSMAIMIGPISYGAVNSAFISGLQDSMGNRDAGYTDDVTKRTPLREPVSVEMTKDGLVVLDSGNNLLRVLKDSKVTTLAGSLQFNGPGGTVSGGLKDGAANNALFDGPRAFVRDSKGDYYIADTENNCIRKLSAGTLRTFAGNGQPGYADGAAKDARFNRPTGITQDAAGNLYVSDSGNNAIRKITLSGEVSTFAGSGPYVTGKADGTRLMASFNEPQDIAYDAPNKRWFVADSGNHLIRIITADKVTTYAGAYKGKDATTGYALPGFKDGALKVAEFNFPKGLQVYKDMLVVTDTGNHAIRVIKGGLVGTIVGDGTAGSTSTPLQAAKLNSPSDAFYDGKLLYIADTRNNVIRAMEIDLALVGKKQVRLIYNGKETLLKESVVESNGKVLIPFSAVMGSIGGTTKVSATKKTVTLTWGAKSKSFTSKTGVVVIGDKVYLDAVAMETFFGADKWDFHPMTTHIVIRR